MSKERKIDVIDVATILAKRKRTIAIIVLTATIIGTVIAFVWPKTYKSEVSFVVSSTNSLNLSGGELLNGLAQLQMGGGSISAEQALVLLRSTEIQDRIINKFNLDEIYGTDIPETLRKKFNSRVEIEDVREGGIGFNSIIALKVAYLGEEPQRAYNIVDYFYKTVDSTIKVLNKKNVEESFLLIERRLQENEEEMARAEDSLVAFQSRYGILEIEEQARAQIGAIAEVRSQLVKIEIQIDYAENILQDSSTRLNDLKAQKRSLERRLNSLMRSDPDTPDPGEDGFNLFQPVEELPALFLEYLRRYRDVMVQEEIYKVLYPQYEQQKLKYEEASSGLLIIDKPVLPTYKDGPKRAYIMIAAFLFGWMVAFIKVFFDKWREDNPDDYQRYKEFKSALSLKNADH